MAMRYRFDRDRDRDRGLVEVVIEGEITAEGLLEWTEQLRGDPDFSAEVDQLVDLRRATGVSMETSEVRSFAQGQPLFKPAARRAVVVGSEFDFGMARMFQVMRGDEAGEIRVFRDIDEARRWLAVD
ncbi:MAG: STAS/SEC14 domain-containing protein [Myxococcota bacterium]